MAGDKYLEHDGAGLLREKAGTQLGGAGNENKIPALGAGGRFHDTMMPTGVGAATQLLEASEALAAGDFVNIFDDSGTSKMRKADATTSGKEAMGFVKENVASAATGTVYLQGNNDQVTGQTAGVVFLDTTAGAPTSSAPDGSGNIVQRIGVAADSDNINFNPQPPVLLA